MMLLSVGLDTEFDFNDFTDSDNLTVVPPNLSGIVVSVLVSIVKCNINNA